MVGWTGHADLTRKHLNIQWQKYEPLYSFSTNIVVGVCSQCEQTIFASFSRTRLLLKDSGSHDNRMYGTRGVQKRLNVVYGTR